MRNPWDEDEIVSGNPWDEDEIVSQPAPRAPATGAAAAATQPFAGFNRGVDNAVQMVSGAGRLVTDRLFEGVNALAGRELFDTSAPSFRPIEATQEAVSGQTYEDLPVNNAYDRYAQRVGEEIGASVPALAGVGAAAQGTRAINAAPKGLFGSALQEFARRPGAYVAGDAAASVASGTGAQGARDAFPGSPVAEMAGQMLAPAAAFSAPAVARGFARGFGPQNAARAQGAIDDAARAGTTLTAGQLASRGTDDITPAGMAEAVSRTAPGGNVVLPRVYARQQDDMAQRVDDVAGSVTRMRSPEGAGQSLRRGVDAAVQRFSDDAEALYGQVDELIPANAPAAMSNARRVAQEVLADSVGEGLDDNRVLTIARTVADENAPRNYRQLSQMRTRVGRLMNDRELISSKPELDRLYAALTDDIADVAQGRGDDAARALQSANDFYRTNRRAIDDYVEPFVAGRRNTLPEATFREFELSAQRGPTAIRELRNRLTMAEGGQQNWDDAVGVVLQRLGRAKSGQQGADGAEFSVETFLTNWDTLRRNGGLDELFTGTSRASMRQDLDAIARTAERMKGNFGNLRNPSGSGEAAVSAGTALFAGQQLATGNLGGAGALLAALGGSTGAGILMSRPWFVRWLAQSTQEPIERLPSYAARLSATAQMAGDEEDQRLVNEYLGNVQSVSRNTP